MGFIDSYKHLEKLCGEVLNDDRRVSAYIDEMLRTPRGSYYVRTWDEDLKNLKHYRWVRNKISHEPDCTEENMCEYGDEQWIIAFYNRIMKQTDPLALYHTEMKRRKEAVKKKEEKREIYRETVIEKKEEKTVKREQGNNTNRVLFAIMIIFAVLLVISLMILRVVRTV